MKSKSATADRMHLSFQAVSSWRAKNLKINTNETVKKNSLIRVHANKAAEGKCEMESKL
jgi:uncharacterized low-complexity protein